jgi:dihydrofolate reductase
VGGPLRFAAPDRHLCPRRPDVSGYEQYWGAILADPEAVLPFTGRVASKGEIPYARFARRTPHIVLSRTLDSVGWRNTRIARDIGEIRRLKQQAGKDIHAVGGGTLVGSLMGQSLIDELRLVVRPIVLGGGKALFKDVRARHVLKLLDIKRLEPGVVRLHYAT